MSQDLASLQRYLASCGGRLYAGCTPAGVALADPQQSGLVLGPPRSGKTSALAIPNTLCAPGPVVVTSTKVDVLAATLEARRGLGECWLLDPSGSLREPDGVRRIRWSPVAAARSWDESLVVARGMTGAARPAGRLGESAHWTERAEALVAPLLHAAHLQGSGMEEVVGWVLRHDLDAASSILAANGVKLGADVLAGIGETDPREQSGIWSSAAGVLAAYRADAVLDHSAPVNFDPASLIDSRDSVYICAPARHQDLVAPIVVAFLDQARSGAYRRWSPGRAPLTLVLDELANVAPIPDLAALVSEGGSQGVVTLGLLQDLSQARQRWGAAADGFLSLFGAKVVLGGIADMSTLELVSRLAGEVDVPASSVSSAPWWTPSGGGPTVTWSTQRQRRLPVDSVRERPPGTGLLISGIRPPELVRLPPWSRVPMLRNSIPGNSIPGNSIPGTPPPERSHPHRTIQL